MRVRKLLIVVVAVALISASFLAGRTVGKKGAPDSPSAPGTTSSYTLEDIYNRLDTGAPGTPGTFTEPTSGPGTGTMHTLNEIMAKARTACTQCNPPGTLSAGGRWCDNKDGTVTDMATGLVWLKKASWCLGKKWEDCTSHDDAHTWAGVLFAGATDADLDDGSEVGDWRLPTKGELWGLTQGTEGVSYYSPQVFTGVTDGYYWSSTTDSTAPEDAWMVDMLGPDLIIRPKTGGGYVWPVRGG